MDNEFNTMLKMRREVRDIGKIKYKEESKIRLNKIATTKIRTTMIGALSTIETYLGFLWSPDEKGNMTAEQIRLGSLYEKVRQEILDNGNNQIRNLKVELEQYEVEWLRYKLMLPVCKLELKMEDKNGQKSS